MCKLLDLRVMDAKKVDVKQLCAIYLEQFVSGKDSQTVKAGILEVLGKLAECFPQEIVALEKSQNILYLLFESLNKQFKATKPDLQIIAGGLKGLNSFLVNFTPQLESGMGKRMQMKKEGRIF
jgi:hypothetical protein